MSALQWAPWFVQVLTVVPDSGLWSGNLGYAVLSRSPFSRQGEDSSAGLGQEASKPSPVQHLLSTVLCRALSWHRGTARGHTVSAFGELTVGERDLVRAF